MYEVLKEEVYTKLDKKAIEATRSIFYLCKLSDQCKLSGFSHVANLSFVYFFQACSTLNIPELLDTPDSEMQSQYRLFLRKLQSVSTTNKHDLDILREFLNTSDGLHKDVELTVHVMVTAAVTKSVESVVESWGSVMEQLSSKSRNISEERLNEELMVSLNGPELQHCDNVLEESLQKLFHNAASSQDRLKGHFIR